MSREVKILYRPSFKQKSKIVSFLGYSYLFGDSALTAVSTQRSVEAAWIRLPIYILV